MCEGFSGGTAVRTRLPMQGMQETWVRPLGQGDPLEEEMTTYCSILPWEIRWTEEPGGPQSMRSQRAGHRSMPEHTHTHTHTHTAVYKGGCVGGRGRRQGVLGPARVKNDQGECKAHPYWGSPLATSPPQLRSRLC